MTTQLLAHASSKLHGYWLHNALGNYLGPLIRDANRLGVMDLASDVEPLYGLFSEESKISTFDGRALHPSALSDLIISYFYIHAAHKKANDWLARDDRKKRVLHLRGFEYQSAYGAGRRAVGVQTADTTRFTWSLHEHLHGEFIMFQTLSPEDLHFGTLGGHRLFDPNDGLLTFMRAAPVGFYLNERHWQEDVARIAGQMDYFVVYVSSITESVLWELKMLKGAGCTDRTTVVFDAQAIANKSSFAAEQLKMKAAHQSGDLWPGRILWPGSWEQADTTSTSDLRDRLAEDFPHVVSPDEFFATIDQQKRRIAQSRGPAGTTTRHVMADFRFRPAIDVEALADLRTLDHGLDTLIRRTVEARQFPNLRWFFNRVQLRILTALMLGDYESAARALEIYSFVVLAVTVRASKDPMHGGLTTSQFKKFERIATQNLHIAREASRSLLTVGSADSHGDFAFRLRLENLTFTQQEAIEFCSTICPDDHHLLLIPYLEPDQHLTEADFRDW